MKLRIRTKKLKVIVEDDGSILGEYSKVWKARTKALLRAHIPDSYTNWRQVPKSLKDDVWNALMGEFELNIPLDMARPLVVKSWSQKFRSFKNKLPSCRKKDDALGGEPKGVDSRTRRKFVENESDPKRQHQNFQNAENRKNLGSSQQHIMQQDHPEIPGREIDELLVVPGRINQTILDIARLAYDDVMGAENGRKSTSLSGEARSDTHLNANNLTQVLRKDTTGQVCGVDSHISEIEVGVAKTTIEQNTRANEKACLTKDGIISNVNTRLDNFEDMMKVMLSKLSNVKRIGPPMVATTVRELGSNAGEGTRKL